MAKEIKLPRICNKDEILKFLSAVEIIFQLKGQKEPDVIFNLKFVENIDILGLLLSYKIIEYSIVHKCISRSGMITCNYVQDKLTEYSFWNLLNAFLAEKKADYKELDFVQKERFFIAPLPLLRKDNYTEDIIKDDFLPKIETYYKNIALKKNINEEKISSMILQFLSEIILNFWEHAVNDTKSIIVANGNENYVEIACADTGNGIISTLGPTLNGNHTKSDILMKSLEEGVTSKKDTNHMGCGLWVLNQIITKSKGRLYLISEGAFVFNDFGKISRGECPYWEGTIIYVFLSLTSPKSISDILNKESFDEINKYLNCI